MSKTRNLSDLLDANGDVKSTALDNVPASDDASALTTGTLDNARLSAVPNSALANSSITINGSATSLGGSTTINTDLVNDTTPQLGGTLDTNGNPINFGDNDKAQFGASQDLKIYHDGSNSRIEDRGTGNLLIGSNGGGITLKQKTDAVDENLAVFTNNSSVDLYYNGAKKLETTTSGVTVTGTLTADGVSVGDNENINVGASNDLQIYHDGSNSWVKDNGTGVLALASNGNGIGLYNADGTKPMVFGTINSHTKLYHDGSEKLSTTSTGVNVTGTLTATAFSGDGSALTNVPAGLSLYNIVKVTSSGTYTPTSGTKFVKVYCTGGGGGGGGISPDQNAYYGSGGNGGNTSVKHYTASELGANATISIGSGGNGGSGASNGSTGGGTTFNPAGTGATLTGYGGYGGKANNGHGNKVSMPEYSHNNATGNADYQFFGEIALLGSVTLADGSQGWRVSGYGGRSFFGRGGASKIWNGQTNQNGSNAPANSGGGGGGAAAYQYASTASGGNGGSGLVIIEEFA